MCQDVALTDIPLYKMPTGPGVQPFAPFPQPVNVQIN